MKRLASFFFVFVSTAGAAAQQCQRNWLPTFGGETGTNGEVHVLGVFDDGGGPALYAGGWFTSAGGVAANSIAQWNGLDWAPVGMQGPGMDGVYALTVFDDGTGPALYVGGSFNAVGGVAANNIAKWDGSNWSALGSGTDDEVLSLEVYDDGNGAALYAGGSFKNAGGIAAGNIARWDGASWSALAGGGVETGFLIVSMAVFDDGSGSALYAGGQFSSIGGVSDAGIARWNGSGWSSVGGGMNAGADVIALEVFDDGSGPALYAGGGYLINAGGVPVGNVAKWDGSNWSGLGSGTNFSVQSLQVFDDGNTSTLVAGGTFTAAGGVQASRIAQWDGTGWAPLGSGLGGFLPSLVVNTMAVFDGGGGPALFAGGLFSTMGGTPTSYLARWDGAEWFSPKDGTNGAARELLVFDDGQGGGPALYAAGEFVSVGGRRANHVARWDGSSWFALGSGVGTSSIDFGVAHSLAAYDDGSGPALFVGGEFPFAGGLVTRNIAKWDGSSWSALGSGMNTSADVLALQVFDDGNGPALFVGGANYTSAGGIPANHIARWDGETWTALEGPGNGTNLRVISLEVFDDGNGLALYAGGRFTSAGGMPAPHIARWDGTRWSTLQGGGANSEVWALKAFDDGSGAGPALYAGGGFTVAGGHAASHVAKWDGASWSPLGSGVNGTVSVLEVFDDGNGPALYAGGAFDSAGGAPAAGVARWDGASWSPVGPGGSGMNGDVFALTVFDDGSGPALFAGGDFTTSASEDSFLAKFGCPEPPPASVYCTAKAGLVCGAPAIRFSGSPSLSVGEPFLILAGPARGNRAGLYVYTDQGRANVPFQGGTLCLAAPVRRSVAVNSGGSASNCEGEFQIDWNAFAQGFLGGTPQAFLSSFGQQVDVQVWGRDSPATGSFLSDALEYFVSN